MFGKAEGDAATIEDGLLDFCGRNPLQERVEMIAPASENPVMRLDVLGEVFN